MRRVGLPKRSAGAGVPSATQAEFKVPAKQFKAPAQAVRVPALLSSAASDMPGAATAAAPASGSGLDAYQQQAVQAPIDKPLIILAGPGSGKTTTLCTRICHLVEEQSVRPAAILAITFSNRAANDMRAKLRALRPSEEQQRAFGRVTIRTFHGFCLAVLRECGRVARACTVYDSHDQKKLVKEVLAHLAQQDAKQQQQQQQQHQHQRQPATAVAAVAPAGATTSASDSAAEVKRIYTFINNCKTAMQRPSEFLRGSLERRAWELYEAKKTENNAIDFNDMLCEFVDMVRGSLAVQQRLRDRFPYVLVDEFQDTNALQLEITRLLSPQVSIVGDDDQMIYGWRGAAAENWAKFKKLFPQWREVQLVNNFRSGSLIVEICNALITSNTARMKRLGMVARRRTPPPQQQQQQQQRDKAGGSSSSSASSSSGGGGGGGGQGECVVWRCRNLAEEAALVVQQIKLLNQTRGIPFSEMAVLYRSNPNSVISRALERALLAGDVPYALVRGTEMFERKLVKDVLAALALLVNAADNVAFERAFRLMPRLGKGSWTKFLAYAHEQRARSRSYLALLLEPRFPLQRFAGKTQEALQRLRSLYRAWLQMGPAGSGGTSAAGVAADVAAVPAPHAFTSAASVPLESSQSPSQSQSQVPSSQPLLSPSPKGSSGPSAAAGTPSSPAAVSSLAAGAVIRRVVADLDLLSSASAKEDEAELVQILLAEAAKADSLPAAADDALLGLSQDGAEGGSSSALPAGQTGSGAASSEAKVPSLQPEDAETSLLGGRVDTDPRFARLAAFLERVSFGEVMKQGGYVSSSSAGATSDGAELHDASQQALSSTPALSEHDDWRRRVARGERGVGVTLSTVHAAKGLEWRAVFGVHLADGVFPSVRQSASQQQQQAQLLRAPRGGGGGGSEADLLSAADAAAARENDRQLQEERRVAYVLASRAKEVLHLSCPMRPYIGDGPVVRESVFVREIMEKCRDLVDARETPEEIVRQVAAQRSRQQADAKRLSTGSDDAAERGRDRVPLAELAPVSASLLASSSNNRESGAAPGRKRKEPSAETLLHEAGERAAKRPRTEATPLFSEDAVDALPRVGDDSESDDADMVPVHVGAASSAFAKASSLGLDFQADPGDTVDLAAAAGEDQPQSRPQRVGVFASSKRGGRKSNKGAGRDKGKGKKVSAPVPAAGRIDAWLVPKPEMAP